jgi:hypothetical protein
LSTLGGEELGTGELEEGIYNGLDRCEVRCEVSGLADADRYRVMVGDVWL